MTRKRWFGASVAAGSSGLLRHAFGRLLARSHEASLLSRCRVLPCPDAGVDASWTASLNRGDDLPPCRLSVLIASGSRSAMRLEPYRSDPESGPSAAKL